MNKIRVYIRSEKNTYEFAGQLAVNGHTCYGWRKETVVKLPEDHERAQKIAEEIAEEQGLELEIYDLSDNFSNKISALLRGIKTPAVEIGNRRLNGVPSKEKLLSLIDEKRIVE